MEPKTKKQRSLYIPYAGPVLLEFPLLNKGSAFSMEERRNFNLLGLLPEVVETIEEQAERAWIQYQGFKTEIDKHIYLRNIQDTNETLFYRLVNNHLDEMYSAAIFLIPICISFDTDEKRRYATYLILNRRFSFEF